MNAKIVVEGNDMDVYVSYEEFEKLIRANGERNVFRAVLRFE